jgi:hypothetical protein
MALSDPRQQSVDDRLLRCWSSSRSALIFGVNHLVYALGHETDDARVDSDTVSVNSKIVTGGAMIWQANATTSGADVSTFVTPLIVQGIVCGMLFVPYASRVRIEAG